MLDRKTFAAEPQVMRDALAAVASGEPKEAVDGPLLLADAKGREREAVQAFADATGVAISDMQLCSTANRPCEGYGLA